MCGATGAKASQEYCTFGAACAHQGDPKGHAGLCNCTLLVQNTSAGMLCFAYATATAHLTLQPL